MIGALLPAKAVTEESFGDLPDAPLFPQEAAVIARAVESRRREFATVRACARRALAGLGVPPGPILPDRRGAPAWPPGVVGSMTHCLGYRACAVASTADLVSLGIDAEPAGPLPEGVLDMVSLPTERRRLAELTAWERESGAEPGQVTHWDRLLFSAKESMFKTWYPLMRSELDFSEAEFDFRTDGTFEARLLVPGPVVNGRRREHFTGRWLSRDGFVATALALGH